MRTGKTKKRALSHPLFWVTALLVVALGVFFLARNSKKHQEAGTKPVSHAVPIVTTTVKKGDIGDFVEALGTVTPVTNVTIYSRVQGQIMSVEYKEGQIVHKGDPLIEIDPRPYEAALKQAEGTLAHDRGLLEEARIDLVRYRKAYARKAIQKQLLDDQEQIVIQDEGSVVADEGTLESARVNLEYCHISSPIDGRVGLRLVDPGNIVQENSTTALVTITQIQPITVIFSIAEDALPKVQKALSKLGAGESMEVDALDRSDEKKLATGSYLSLDNQIDTTTGTIRVRATFDNKNGELFPNQFVNARLLVATDRGATLVATPAIQRGAQGSFVYAIGYDETAKMHPVKVGLTEGELTEVQGVQPGDEVAISGFDKLQDGSKVAAQKQEAQHQLAGTTPSVKP